LHDRLRVHIGSLDITSFGIPSQTSDQDLLFLALEFLPRSDISTRIVAMCDEPTGRGADPRSRPGAIAAFSHSCTKYPVPRPGNTPSHRGPQFGGCSRACVMISYCFRACVLSTYKSKKFFRSRFFSDCTMAFLQSPIFVKLLITARSPTCNDSRADRMRR
jgi:hypothetical protein